MDDSIKIGTDTLSSLNSIYRRVFRLICMIGIPTRMVMIFIVLLNLAGCSLTSRPEKSDADLLAERRALLRFIQEGRDRFDQKIIERIVLEQARAAYVDPEGPKPVFDLLIISGGGDYGAFGAGVLQGWGKVEDPTNTRPEFDVVTGVSTGALIAPYAFIGSDEAIDRIYTLYTNPDEDWVKFRPGLFFLPSNVSLADPSGLEAFEKEQFTLEFIDKVSRGWSEHRQMLIGTTNLDMGFMRIFDLTRIADEATESQDASYFLSVLRASTAIPGAFPPVEIDGHLHVDGGATLSIFLPTPRNLIVRGERLEDRLPEGVVSPKFRIWAIVNNKLIEQPENTGPSWLENVSRSLSTAIRASVLITLRDLETTALLGRAAGQDIEFRYIAIPEAFQVPDSDSMFDPDTMQTLGELGIKLGSDPGSWKTNVPGPEWANELFMNLATPK